MDDRLHEKLDEISKDITEIKVTMAVNTSSLEEHIRRTTLLEERAARHEEQLEIALLPIKTGKFLIAFTAGITTLAGAIYGLYRLLIK